MFEHTSSDSHPADVPEGSVPVRPLPRRSSRLAATILGVALFGGLIGVAADRWAVNTFGSNPLNVSIPTVTTGPRIGPIAAPNGTSTTAQPAPASTASDPTQVAIEQV